MAVADEQIRRATNIVTAEDASRHETNDCAVMAFVNAFGMTYKDAHTHLKAHGRQDACGTYLDTIWSAAGGRVEFKTKQFLSERSPTKVCKLATAMPAMQHGTWLAATSTHIFCVKHGKILDRFVNPDNYLICVMKVRD